MKRAAIERPRVRNVWALHNRLNRARMGADEVPQIGRFRKSQRVGGCGNTACMLCHAGKLLGDERVSERRSRFDYVEGLDEALR